MKNILLLALFVVSALSVNAQKRADIDNYRIYVRTAKLPANFIEPEKRTYSTVGTSAEDMKIYGWKKVPREEATVLIKVENRGVAMGQGKLDTKKTQKKDKDGKVISTTTTYQITSSNKGSGVVRLYGPKNEMPKPKKAPKKSKKKKKKKKEEPKEENPFLANVDTDAPPADEAADTEDEKVNREQSYFQWLNQSYDYNTGYKKTSKTAWNTYNSNKYSQIGSHRESFMKSARRSAQSFANQKYGYAPTKTNVKFKILDSKKHAEYKTYQQAMEGAKAIFSKSRYNHSNEQMKKDLAPIIDYMIGLTEKYKEDSKHPKRIKSSAYYNLAQIYYYLDDLENAKKYSQKLIDMKMFAKDAKKIIKNSDSLAKQFAFHQMTQRHLTKPLEEGEEEELVDEEVEEETEEEEGGNE